MHISKVKCQIASIASTWKIALKSEQIETRRFIFQSRHNNKIVRRIILASCKSKSNFSQYIISATHGVLSIDSQTQMRTLLAHKLRATLFSGSHACVSIKADMRYED